MNLQAEFNLHVLFLFGCLHEVMSPAVSTAGMASQAVPNYICILVYMWARDHIACLLS